jgi:hypothetical protein
LGAGGLAATIGGVPKPNPKKSIRQSKVSKVSLVPKGWLEPERQSLEDVAAQWGKSMSFVEECIRTLKFNHIILVDNSRGGLPITDHFYFDKDSWPFNGSTMKQVGTCPPVIAYFFKRSTYPHGFSWPNGKKVYIPVAEVKRVKNIKEVKNSSPQKILKADYHSECLEAANYCSYQLYGLGKLVSHRGHRDQIEQLLEEKYGDKEWLTKEMKKQIATIVNKNKNGGSPRSSPF